MRFRWDLVGFRWDLQGFHGIFHRSRWGFEGFSWSFMGDFMGSDGKKVRIKISDNRWGLVGFSGIYWNYCRVQWVE